MDRLRSRRRRRRDLEEELRLLASYRGQTVTKTVRGMMYYRKALELQAFLDMAKDEGASRNFVMITSKTSVQIPESAFPKRERQSQWTVPDTELRESLRLAVAEVLLPAYRSFLKRFGPLVESGKNSQRYIKYTAEDLERLLDELFEGKSMNEPRR
uniref:Exocyst subunit Exo70 family protein n=1 Tax=Brassica oleracea var. oleracea TaxID=109376 RepID=A0A0D3DTL4_BRAOL